MINCLFTQQIDTLEGEAIRASSHNGGKSCTFIYEAGHDKSDFNLLVRRASEFFIHLPWFLSEKVTLFHALSKPKMLLWMSVLYPLSRAVCNNYYNNDYHKHELIDYALKHMNKKTTYFSLLAHRASESESYLPNMKNHLPRAAGQRVWHALYEGCL